MGYLLSKGPKDHIVDPLTVWDMRPHVFPGLLIGGGQAAAVYFVVGYQQTCIHHFMQFWKPFPSSLLPHYSYFIGQVCLLTCMVDDENLLDAGEAIKENEILQARGDATADVAQNRGFCVGRLVQSRWFFKGIGKG